MKKKSPRVLTVAIRPFGHSYVNFPFRRFGSFTDSLKRKPPISNSLWIRTHALELTITLMITELFDMPSCKKRHKGVCLSSRFLSCLQTNGDLAFYDDRFSWDIFFTFLTVVSVFAFSFCVTKARLALSLTKLNPALRTPHYYGQIALSFWKGNSLYGHFLWPPQCPWLVWLYWEC